nr:hypothetical protein [uncultured Lachnoanaerobaculum sp.]
MHVLDSKITEIEERIKEIVEYAPKQEGTTMQETVLSYGWILLDSWIAWRTLRFLLRGVSTIEKVQEKWLQTPSSYTAAQLSAVWGFKDSTRDYLEENIKNNVNQIFNDLIQKKRNASAHFAPKTSDPNTNISGEDSKVIQDLYEGLSKVFLFYESMAFWKDVQTLLNYKGYEKLKVNFKCEKGETKEFEIDSKIYDALLHFDKDKGYKVIFNDKDNLFFVIVVEENGCKIGFSSDTVGDALQAEDVLKFEKTKYYKLLGNKGYYVHIEEFVKNIEEFAKKHKRICKRHRMICKKYKKCKKYRII